MSVSVDYSKALGRVDAAALALKAPLAIPTFTGTLNLSGTSANFTNSGGTFTLNLTGLSIAEERLITSGTGYGDWRWQTGNTASGLSGALRLYDVKRDAEVARFTSTGRFSVNVANPSAYVHVSSSDGNYSLGLSGTTKGIRVEHSSSQTTIRGVDSTLTASYQPLAIGGSTLSLETNGSTQALFIDASQRIGVGTNSPLVALHVKSQNVSGRGQIEIEATDYSQISAYNGSTKIGELFWQNNAGGERLVLECVAGSVQLFAGGAEGLRVASSGKIGINNPTPSYQLDVWGDFRASADGGTFGVRAATLGNLSTANTAEKWVGLSMVGASTGAATKEGALLAAIPLDSDWTSSYLSFYVRNANNVVQQLTIEPSGMIDFKGLSATSAASVASTHKIAVKINGATYYLLASNV